MREVLETALPVSPLLPATNVLNDSSFNLRKLMSSSPEWKSHPFVTLIEIDHAKLILGVKHEIVVCSSNPLSIWAEKIL